MTFHSLSIDSTIKWLAGAISAVFIAYSVLLLSHKSLHNLITLPHSDSHQWQTAAFPNVLCRREQKVKVPVKEYLTLCISEARLTSSILNNSGRTEKQMNRDNYYKWLLLTTLYQSFSQYSIKAPDHRLCLCISQHPILGSYCIILYVFLHFLLS